MKRLPALAFVIALFLGIGQMSAKVQGQNIQVSARPCPVAPALTEIEDQTVVCGAVTVPENYAQSEGAQIDLAFAVLKSASLSPAADPVIYLHGGPGAAELRDLSGLSQRFASFRQTHDVVIFDQRGTGFSNGRLTCEAEYATRESDIRATLQEQGNVGDMDYAVNVALFQICLDRFEKIGTDLTEYNTINNARDVANIADALGYDTVNLYGFSYGTQLALEIMRQHPEIVRSVILDSVAPADIKLYENFGQPNVEAIASLLGFCADDEACKESYPNLASRFQTLLEQLNTDPIVREDDTVVTASSIVDALRQNNIRPGLGAYIPLLIWELEQGKLELYDAIQRNSVPPVVLADVDPAAQRYEGSDVSHDAIFFIETALRLREQAFRLEETADTLLRQGDAAIERDRYGTSPAARFDLLFHEILADEPFDRRLELNQAYMAMPIEGETVDLLRAFIDRNFVGLNADRLTALATAMTDEDVAELADLIFGKARDYAYFFDVALALSLYMCQEHVPYNTLDGMQEAFAHLPLAQVGTGKFRTAARLIGYCDLFPSGLEPASFHEPVVSDIPALIMLGSADTQTATSWGLHAAQSLSNSQALLFPETGHGAFRYSQCARDIGAAFFNDPHGEMNTECIDNLLPEFVLPPEEE